MKTCCVVWEIPVIEGEHYNPIINVIYMQKAKKFLNQVPPSPGTAKEPRLVS